LPTSDLQEPPFREERSGGPGNGWLVLMRVYG
jgi:hypothetical protein